LVNHENEKKKAANIVSLDLKHKFNIPIFDIKKANKMVPKVDWNGLSPTFSLDDLRKLHHYIVEDSMFADPS
jgi:hypothetical protein